MNWIITTTTMLIMLAGITVANFESVPFFRSENAGYYTDFAQNNPQLTPEQVVLYVNVGLHYPFYENIRYVDDPYYTRVLVNKFHRLPQEFSPTDLAEVAPGHYMRQMAANAFLEMRTELLAQEGLELVVRSAYRSYALQSQIYSNNVATMGQVWADMWSARPGHSEHQTGLALDMLQPGMGGGSLGNANFQDTYQYAWLNQNAYRFGFILSYPLGYTNVTGYEYEPWHWRYVGVSTATYMFFNNIPTLDHYFATRYEAEDIVPLVSPLTQEPTDPTEPTLYTYPIYEEFLGETGEPETAAAGEGEGEGSTVFTILLTIIGIIVAILVAFVLAVFALRYARKRRRRAIRRNKQLRSLRSAGGAGGYGGYMVNTSTRGNRPRGSGRPR